MFFSNLKKNIKYVFSNTGVHPYRLVLSLIGSRAVVQRRLAELKLYGIVSFQLFFWMPSTDIEHPDLLHFEMFIAFFPVCYCANYT